MQDFYQTHSAWLLPLLIFVARLVDVSIGTLRIVFLARGMKVLAPLCGFFEVVVWLLALGQIMNNLTSWPNYLAYAAGFSFGNYAGLWIEARMAMGMVSVWIVTHKDATGLLDKLKEARYGLTSVGARGARGKVRILIVVVRRRHLDRLSKLIHEHTPDAFVTIQDVRTAGGTGFERELSAPPRRNSLRRLSSFRGLRKGK